MILDSGSIRVITVFGAILFCLFFLMEFREPLGKMIRTPQEQAQYEKEKQIQEQAYLKAKKAKEDKKPSSKKKKQFVPNESILKVMQGTSMSLSLMAARLSIWGIIVSSGRIVPDSSNRSTVSPAVRLLCRGFLGIPLSSCTRIWVLALRVSTISGLKCGITLLQASSFGIQIPL